MRALIIFLFCLSASFGYAQDSVVVPAPAGAAGQIEDFMEVTKSAVANTPRPGKAVPAETRADVNRLLIISANDFLRALRENPTKEAYLACLDKGLTRVAPLTASTADRQQVADFYQELVEIVGLASSEGRLATFVAQQTSAAKQ